MRHDQDENQMYFFCHRNKTSLSSSLLCLLFVFFFPQNAFISEILYNWNIYTDKFKDMLFFRLRISGLQVKVNKNDDNNSY